MLYTMSELIETIKDDIGVKDIPLPVSDIDIRNRIVKSALKEFSVRYPFIKRFRLGDAEKIESETMSSGITYRIPKWVYDSLTILSVPKVDIVRTSGYSDMYVPQGYMSSPDDVLLAIADIQIAAAIGGTMGRSPTHRYIPPDKIMIYNGWSSGTYVVDVAMTHDPSLITVPSTAITNFKELATLDVQQYLYNRLKRIQDLDLGVGTINIKVDDWQDAGQQKKELLKEWDESGSFDIDSIRYW